MEVKTSAGASASTLREREQDAAEFLIDTRNLTPEQRWKISVMIETANLFNIPQLPTRAAGVNPHRESVSTNEKEVLPCQNSLKLDSLPRAIP